LPPDLRLAILSFVENCPDVQMSSEGQLLVCREIGNMGTGTHFDGYRVSRDLALIIHAATRECAVESG
jgi:hypothetical protein